ncbi:Nucleoside phosphatase GDA1/CD39 [Macleaya cordata]|uniref:Nucleoside phosphatase GDA1/CD39 n=1 Tax=Macleaya cordata TaxID=56857 RepID=A0A200PLT9_MACCD|nr:Nucleoside phosphatase GDA1/CD39 [Macleaya cordata]
MALSRIADLVSGLSAAASRVTIPHSPSGPLVSSGLLLTTGPVNGFGLPNPRQNSNLRQASSLQDFSAFRKHDPEEGNLDFGINQSVTRAKLSRSLERQNGGSSFSKEKAFPIIQSIKKKWMRTIMGILCLFICFFLIFTCTRYFSTYRSKEASKFYVVLDCGSTGTRVYVYESFIDQKIDSSLPIVLRSIPKDLHKKSSSQSWRAYQRMETEPGFDKLVRNTSGLKAAIKPLLKWAEKQIPKNAHKSTSLFLYATAGVRRLPHSDSEWLMDKAWSILKKSSFMCRRDWIKIITGMEEAYYGWVALNYHMGMLGSIPAKATFGALDLGGSSLQVTFETKELVHDDTSLNLSIGTINHHLSAYSLSGYGLNDAFDKSVVHLLKRLPGISNADLISGKVKLKHPCLQSGYKERYICSQCASLHQEGGSPLTGGKNMGKGGKRGIAVELLGDPQWEKCSALAKVTVNLSEWSNLSPGVDCEMQPCALSDSLPRPHGQFYAMSGFFVVFRFFNLTSAAKLDDVLQKGQEFCKKTWEVAKNSVVPQPFIEQYCFRAPYIVSLLRDGLHIRDSEVVIGSGSITWTLGVALLEAGGKFPTGLEFHSYRILQMKIKPAILIVMVFISLIFLVYALSCVGNWMPKFFRRPYLPIIRQNSATALSAFRFQRWSPISTGDARTKTPLSPTISGSQQQRPFSIGHGLGGSSIQLMDSSLHPSNGSVSHSYSSGSLGQMQFDNNGMGSSWAPHRSQMRLQSRRSQSREDLSLSEEMSVGPVTMRISPQQRTHPWLTNVLPFTASVKTHNGGFSEEDPYASRAVDAHPCYMGSYSCHLDRITMLH